MKDKMEQIMGLIIKFKYYCILMLFILISVGLNIFEFIKIESLNDIEPVKCEECICDEKEEANKIITYKVDIKGAVKNPGVYEVAENSVVNDVIRMSGGLKSTASTSNINLSKKVTDEMVIYVFTKSEIKENSSTNNIVCEIPACSCEEIKIDSSGNILDLPGTDNSQTIAGKVSINTGTKEELMTLSGIGESKALAIIEYRNTNGKFQKIEDIQNVSGIGESAFEKIKDNITL